MLRHAMINNALGSPCPLCRTPLLPRQRLHLDHIIARSLGGTDDPRNLQVVHRRCNLKKGRGDTPVRLTYR
jgi:5-methylcytosine-specific restriction endonuclease McrA